MKKILVTITVVLGLLLGLKTYASLEAYAWRFTQRNADNDGDQVTFVSPTDGSLGVMAVLGTPNVPKYYLLGTGLTSDSTSLKVDNVPQANVTGLTSALAGKFSTPTGTTSQYLRGDGSLSTLPSVMSIAYEGTSNRTNSFPIFKTATVSSGVAVFHLTADGTSGGTALFTNGVIQDSVNVTVSDSAASYQMSWAWSNSNKTLTVTANKLTTANILTGVLGQGQANASVVKLAVWGY